MARKTLLRSVAVDGVLSGLVCGVAFLVWGRIDDPVYRTTQAAVVVLGVWIGLGSAVVAVRWWLVEYFSRRRLKTRS